MKKRDLPVIVSNHQDLTWRRCFERDIEYRGEKYASYSHLQALYILDNLEKCEKHPEWRFTLECVATLQKFLESHPDKKEIIEKYLKEGRMHIPFTGHNIVDSNLILGESIIRNYLYGYEYLKNNFSYFAEGFDRNDSFGNSAQLPQIARGFGMSWVYNVVYTNIDEDYWMGLDGSVLCQVKPKLSAISGGYAKFRPCPACRGEGGDCPVCHGDKIDREFAEWRRSQISVDRDDPKNEELQGYLYVSAEELLPSDGVFDWIENNRDKYNIFFSNYKDIAHRYYEDKIALAGTGKETSFHPSREVNFNNTGVYATRINTKKNLRALEMRTYALEGMLTMKRLMGEEYPKKEMDAVWNKLLFSMFHDAVTGTMVDRAYDELMDVHSKIASALSCFEASLFESKKDGENYTVINANPSPVSNTVQLLLPEGHAPVTADGERLPIMDWKKEGEHNLITVLTDEIAPHSKKVYKSIPAPEAFEKESFSFSGYDAKAISAVLRNDVDTGENENTYSDSFTFENEYLRVVADSRGICSIYDKKSKKTVACESDYKIGEWILEHDEGSPWATLSDDMRRMPMARATGLIAYEKTADYHRLTYKVNRRFWAYAVDAGHDITYTVTLMRGERKLRFNADVFWDCQNHRLRIAFPTPFKGGHIYEIPYGHIAREPYKSNCVWPHGPSNWASANGDCPAINWAGVEGEDASVAVLNRGIPCYRIENDSKGQKSILLTPLRSPSIGTYLHEPDSYSMTEYYEMRDAGRHSFEYAIEAFDGTFSENDAVISAHAYNSRLYCIKGDTELPEMPVLAGEGVRVSSVKLSEDGKGIIYRLCEYRGKGAMATLKLPAWVDSVFETDLKEDTVRDLPKESAVTISFEPFKIKTLKFTFKGN